MKVAMLFTGSGPLVILSSDELLTSPALLDKLAAKGVDKFVAWEIRQEMPRQRYGGHYDVVAADMHETDDLRALADNGEWAPAVPPGRIAGVDRARGGLARPPVATGRHPGFSEAAYGRKRWRSP